MKQSEPYEWVTDIQDHEWATNSECCQNCRFWKQVHKWGKCECVVVKIPTARKRGTLETLPTFHCNDWKPNPHGARYTDVWDDVAPGTKFNAHLRQHPNEKPVTVLARLIELSVEKGGLGFDPFLGSGTTMCAAEGLGRLCIGMEISEAYTAVCLERMLGMGLEPELT